MGTLVKCVSDRAQSRVSQTTYLPRVQAEMFRLLSMALPSLTRDAQEGLPASPVRLCKWV